MEHCDSPEYIYDPDRIAQLLDNESMDFFHRVDSNELIYEHAQKKASILGKKYLKGEKLGEGSYGKVKEVLDIENLCRRAIKILKQKKLRRIPNGEDNVKREITIMKKLHHVNVLGLIEVFRNDEKMKLYMVLEYCCCNMQDMLEKSPKKRLPEWQAHSCFVQLIEGVQYLHSQRVVHKDIKPGNLLIATEGTLKISDLGVAEELNLFAQDDKITMSQGSPAFQAPEIANGDDDFHGFKVDVWACGITLFNMITGQYPFEGDTIYKLFDNIVKCEFTIPDWVDEHLQSLIKGMLQREAKNRLSTHEIKAHTWCRKQQPRNGSDRVGIPALDTDDDRSAAAAAEDKLRNTTVYPYLEHLVADLQRERLQPRQAAEDGPPHHAFIGGGAHHWTVYHDDVSGTGTTDSAGGGCAAAKAGNTTVSSSGAHDADGASVNVNGAGAASLENTNHNASTTADAGRHNERLGTKTKKARGRRAACLVS